MVNIVRGGRRTQIITFWSPINDFMANKSDIFFFFSKSRRKFDSDLDSYWTKAKKKPNSAKTSKTNSSKNSKKENKKKKTYKY